MPGAPELLEGRRRGLVLPADRREQSVDRRVSRASSSTRCDASPMAPSVRRIDPSTARWSISAPDQIRGRRRLRRRVGRSSPRPGRPRASRPPRVGDRRGTRSREAVRPASTPGDDVVADRPRPDAVEVARIAPVSSCTSVGRGPRRARARGARAARRDVAASRAARRSAAPAPGRFGRRHVQHRRRRRRSRRARSRAGRTGRRRRAPAAGTGAGARTPAARLDRRRAEQPDLGVDLRRAGVDLERARARSGRAQGRGRAGSTASIVAVGRHAPGDAQHVAACEVLALGADEVRRHARDRARAILRSACASAATGCGRVRPEGSSSASSPTREAVAGERARHDGACALDREDPIDEQTGARGLGRGGRGEHRVEGAAGARRRPRRCATTPGRSGAPASAVPATCSRTSSAATASVSSSTRSRFVSAMTPPLDAEDVEDLQVLLGLRLPPLVGRHHEQHQAHRPDARQHVADEAFVARHVDEPDLAAGRQRAPRVAEVDRESAPLLLFEAVGLDTGEAHDERGLPVVDVAGGGDDTELAGHAQSSSSSSPSSA